MKSPLRTSLTLLLGLSAAVLLRAEVSAAAKIPNPEPDVEVRVLPRTRPDRLYELKIALPPSYGTQPERKYPVILVTDGYWGWQSVRNICGSLIYGKHLPEVLVVSLGYAGENLDYGTLRQDDLAPLGSPDKPDTGHANRFLDLIEQAILPLLEKEYRADPAHRYLLGGSAGGLFALYAMYMRPDLFQGIVADSPSSDSLWNLEREFAEAGKTTAARVFITTAENEMTWYQDQIKAFYRRMQARGYVKGGIKYRQIDGVRHGAGGSESYMQGLLWVADPIAPEHGVQTDLIPPDPHGRPGFTVSFWPAPTWAATDDVAKTAKWREHIAYWTHLPKEKGVDLLFSGVSPDDVARRDSVAWVYAAQRGSVVAAAEDDPAVRAGLLRYEVLPGANP